MSHQLQLGMRDGNIRFLSSFGDGTHRHQTNKRQSCFQRIILKRWWKLLRSDLCKFAHFTCRSLPDVHFPGGRDACAAERNLWSEIGIAIAALLCCLEHFSEPIMTIIWLSQKTQVSVEPPFFCFLFSLPSFLEGKCTQFSSFSPEPPAVLAPTTQPDLSWKVPVTPPTIRWRSLRCEALGHVAGANDFAWQWCLGPGGLGVWTLIKRGEYI